MGSLSASQTPIEQEEDAGSKYKVFKTNMNCLESIQYAKSQERKRAAIETVIKKQDGHGLKTDPEFRRNIASIVMRAQFA